MYGASIVLLLLTAGTESAQPSAPQPNTKAPMRDLPWGQLNFLHSTDTHGWHGGHLAEPNYSADWGDYISFAHHMRAKADKDGVDLLLIDTGDRVEGNGLYDASDPKGLYTFDIFKHQDIDVLCAGNHELYKANSSNNEYFQSVPNFKGNYLASNLDIHDNKTGELKPLAPRYKKLTTKNQGIRVVAFGFIFNFQGSSDNTKVTFVEEAIKQSWFQEAIRDRDVDLFLVAGHVGLRMDEFNVIFKAIRAQQWNTPIHFFGGHTHVRDYAKYDRKAYAIESGRYMETIGFASISGLRTDRKHEVDIERNPLRFKRRYIDNNMHSYYHHTGLNSTTFPTELGKNVTKQISRARNELKLDRHYGCAPQDYWLARADIKNESSIFRWLGEEVFPDQFSEKDPAAAKLVLTNTGAIRFDVFKGPFTRDTEYQVTPFTTGFRQIRGVEYKTASKVLEVLNNNGQYLQALDPSLDATLLVSPWPLSDISNSRGNSESSEGQHPLTGGPSNTTHLTPGYTTKDDAGTDGDDTIHSRIHYYNIPNCMQTEVDFPRDAYPTTVDLVYNEFVEPWIILALRFLGKHYDKADTSQAMDGRSMTNIITSWIERNWPCEEDGVHMDL